MTIMDLGRCKTCLIGEVLLLDELHLRPEEGGVVEGVVDVLVVQRVLAVRHRDGEPPARPARHPALEGGHCKQIGALLSNGWSCSLVHSIDVTEPLVWPFSGSLAGEW